MTAANPRQNAGAGASASRDTVRLLGVRIDRLTLAGLLSNVEGFVAARRRATILYVNIHCMNVRARDEGLARCLEAADLVYCDGTGVHLASEVAGKPLPARMTGADWIHDLCRLCVRREHSLFLLGGAPGSAQEAATALQVRHPGLRIAGTGAGYDVTSETVQRINASAANIVLVGMGTPSQELWIEEHRHELQAEVVWAVGALFDFVSGRIWRGPPLLTNHGFEWLCRLVVEPRKLWRRYLIGNPQFLWRVIRYYRLRPLIHKKT